MSPLALLSRRLPSRGLRGARAMLAIVFPWLLLLLVVGLVFMDQARSGGGPALDHVCGMSIRAGSADSTVFEGNTYYFCSTYCREEFHQNPSKYAAGGYAGGEHLMRGLPTWMVQAGVALLLVLSFGLFELLSQRRSRKKAPAAMGARFDLTELPGVRWALKSPILLFALRAGFAGAFLLIIAAGLFGNQNPAMNIAPLLTWTVWWTGLIFVVLFVGKAWCAVCPWDALATWVERLKFWGPRKGGLGLGLSWPKAMRNVWPAVALFLLLTWIELGMGVTLVPRATAWIALGMLGLAVASVMLFERKAFCRYGCLVGRVSGLYALFSSLEVRAKDRDVCASCKTSDCYKGNEKGDGCPTFEFPKTMSLSTYCTMCAECFKTCPEDNVALRLRPWGADLAGEGKPRIDEAFLALVLLSMTGFHGLSMTPSWPAWNAALQSAWSISYFTSFSLLMSLMLALPIMLYAGFTWAASEFSDGLNFKTVFLNYAYALLPIALFYHLAHNAEHFLMEGPKLAALISDPFGWGWNVFGTAGWRPAPAITMEGLWGIQLLFVIVGHIYSLWITQRTTRRLLPDGKRVFLSQLPMLAAMVAFSVFSLWLLKQPMEMRVSAM